MRNKDHSFSVHATLCVDDGGPDCSCSADLKTNTLSSQADGEAAAARSNCAKVLAVCVVILSVLLVSSIGAIIYG